MPMTQDFVAGVIKRGSKIYAKGPYDHQFLSFSHAFMCIPEVIIGPNYIGWQAKFGPLPTY